MMRPMKANFAKAAWRCGAAAALVIAAASAPVQAAAPAMPFAPHRAVYELKLDEAHASKNIAGVEGRMVFDLRGSPCAGYTLENRMVTRIVDAEGVEVVSDIRSSTWEDAEGETFRFTSSQYMNSQLTENLKGQAIRRPEDGAIKVMLDGPQSEEVRIKHQAKFPTQFSIKILEAARQDERVVQTKIYDGTESGDKVFATTAFIGEAVVPGADDDDLKGHDRLKSLRSWPVSISYFEAGKANDGVPSYELSFRLYENGVSRKLRIDYGTFALTGQLSSLEFHDPETCGHKPG